MTREQLIRFTRALVATLLAGIVIWIFHQLGVQVPVPTVTTTPP